MNINQESEILVLEDVLFDLYHNNLLRGFIFSPDIININSFYNQYPSAIKDAIVNNQLLEISEIPVLAVEFYDDSKLALMCWFGQKQILGRFYAGEEHVTARCNFKFELSSVPVAHDLEKRWLLPADAADMDYFDHYRKDMSDFISNLILPVCLYADKSDFITITPIISINILDRIFGERKRLG